MVSLAISADFQIRFKWWWLQSFDYVVIDVVMVNDIFLGDRITWLLTSLEQSNRLYGWGSFQESKGIPVQISPWSYEVWDALVYASIRAYYERQLTHESNLRYRCWLCFWCWLFFWCFLIGFCDCSCVGGCVVFFVLVCCDGVVLVVVLTLPCLLCVEFTL